MQTLLASVGGLDDEMRLVVINRFFNIRIVYALDTVVWGVEDCWASPLEMLGKGRGDCEEYVIGRYFSLLAAGTASARLRLVYVRATPGQPGQPDHAALAHMVLAYSAALGDDLLILDNQIKSNRRDSASLALAGRGAGADVQLQWRRPVAGRRRACRRQSGDATVALARCTGQGARRRVSMKMISMKVVSMKVVSMKGRACR